MEQRLNYMFRRSILLCFIAAGHIFITTVSAGEPQVKQRKISFFHRHYDCLATIHYKGQLVNSTLKHQGQHLDNVSVQFVAFGRHFVVDLHLNKQLFSGSYVEKVFHSYGQSSEKIHIAGEHENCYYHGSLRFQPESEAAISTCDGLSGYITDKQDTYHIEPRGGKILRIYRNRDQRQLPFRCGTEGHDSRLNGHHTILKRHKRSIRAPYDSNKNTRYVELYLVNDYRTYERHGKNTAVIIKRSQDIANIVSSLYRQLNIYVVLVGVEVWSGGDHVSITTSADKTMENFLRYRKERINPKHHNDNAQLITGVFFDHGVVGKAIKGPICTHQFSGGVNMDYGGLVTLVATTVAHEMGHNFGMEHDNDTMCECRNDKCIMAATSGQISPRRWSSCSQNALEEAFDLGMDYCLRNLPTTVYKGPICGNGFKEDGEECDCGMAQECTNRCCNASSCKLYPLAQCATGKCCDLDSCRPKSSSTLCREPAGECDLPEFCNGTSEYCPNDTFLQNGLQCKGGQSYCYNGQCNTHTDQCKLLWGDTGRVSDPICFQQLNMNGDNDGNCGYNWTTDRYKRCDKEDVMCGLLHCVHLNEKLMFWRDNLAIDMRASFLSRGNKQYVCRSAMLDVGLDMPDPGFVPDGAKCERNKVCINHQCVALAKLKVPKCETNCNGKGRCNSRGNCHCNSGYAPPLCNSRGYGGSIDSGPPGDGTDLDSTTMLTMVTKFTGPVTPASNPSVATNSSDHMPSPGENNDVLIALLVVFLLIIPLIVLVIIGFLNRRRLAQWWKLMPNFKYRMCRKSGKQKPLPPQPPQPNPAAGQSRKDFNQSYRENLISNPMMHRGTHVSDVHPKPKVWNPGNSVGGHKPAPPPPERPAAPRRPPSLVKSSSTAENKPASKKVRLSIPIQETEGPPSATSKQKSSSQFVTPMTGKQESGKNIPQSPKTNPIVKRESFRGSEISDPVLVCTTNRNSLVLADGNVDIIGPEARMVSKSPSPNRQGTGVKRSQSDRPISKGDKLRATSISPPPSASTLKKSASARSPARSPTRPSAPVTNNTSGFRSRPVPPIPAVKEDDTQPVYTNETSDMNDLLSVIDGALKDSSILYSNTLHHPIQETAPPAPPRPSTVNRPGPTQQNKPSTTASQKQANSVPPRSNVDRSSAMPSSKNSISEARNKFGSAVNSNTDTKNNPVSKQTNQNQPSTFKAPASSVDSKNTPVTPSKPSDGSSKLSGAVSDELRNKILSRAGSSATQAKTGNQPPVKTGSTAASVSDAVSPPQKSNKPALGNKSTAKASGIDVHKPINKPDNSLGLSKTKSPPSKLSSSVVDNNQSKTAGVTNRPSQAGNKSIADTSASKNRPATPKASVNSNSFSNSGTTGSVKTNQRTASPGVKSNVSSIAAKFTQSSEGTDSKKTLQKSQGQVSEELGKRTLTRKTSDVAKPALPAKPDTSTKPEASVRSGGRVQSMVGGLSSSKPALQPKPGDQASTGTLPRTTSSSAQPKRVQSYRI